MSKSLLDPAYYVQTFVLARSGTDFELIAPSLDPPVKRKVFLRWFESDPALKSAWERGRAEFDPMTEVTARITNPSQMAFLVAYAECGNIGQSLQAAGIDRVTHNRWLRFEPLYAEAFQISKELFGDRLVSAAVSRAVDGMRRYKFHQGMPVWKRCHSTHPEAVQFIDDLGKVYYQHHYYEIEYSDRLLELLLNARVQEFKEIKLAQQVNIQQNNTSNNLSMKELLDCVEGARTKVIDAESVKQVAKQYIEAHTPRIAHTLDIVEQNDDDDQPL